MRSGDIEMFPCTLVRKLHKQPWLLQVASRGAMAVTMFFPLETAQEPHTALAIEMAAEDAPAPPN